MLLSECWLAASDSSSAPLSFAVEQIERQPALVSSAAQDEAHHVDHADDGLLALLANGQRQ